MADICQLSFRFATANKTILDNTFVFQILTEATLTKNELTRYNENNEMESHLSLRVKHSYEEQVRAYPMAFTITAYTICPLG